MRTLKTYRLDRLYFQFLKPKNVPLEKLGVFVAKLYEAGFIEVYACNEVPDAERYSENEKLTNKQNRDELFKMIGGL